MKHIFSILLILVFAFSAFGQKTVDELKTQAKPFKNSKRYSIQYDKFEDRTLVNCVGFNLISNMAGAMSIIAGGVGAQPTMMFLGSGFMFSGNKLEAEPDEYFLIFNYSGAQWQFLRTSKLIALADDERIQFGDGEAIRDVKRGGVSELIAFKATKEQMQKLVLAKNLEIKVGNYATPLKDEYKEMFSNVLDLADLSKMPVKKK